MIRPLHSAAALLILASAPAFAADAPGSIGSKIPPPVSGEQVYRQVCQSCHMADGRGGTGAATIPSLANNSRLKYAAYPLTIVAKGKGAMPWHTDLLKPAQIAAVVGYVRTHFGNDYKEPVTEAEAAKLAGTPPVERH